MKKLFGRLVLDDAGQDLIEYARLAPGISLAAIGGIQALGTTLNTEYDGIAGTVETFSGGS